MKRISDEVMHSVLAHLSSGLSIKQSCQLAGVSHDAFQRWAVRHNDQYMDALAAGRQALRVSLLSTIDSPLPASTRAARRAANRAAWQVERRILHTYNNGRPKR